jgi:tRNA wybutosine-synthesizing protein 4
MLKHFDKLNTSLKSVHQYPTVETQRTRFQDRGWKHVEIWDLWEAWNSKTFLDSDERLAVDEVEPFDEWEEFILFARHYFVMHARASTLPTTVRTTNEIDSIFQVDASIDVQFMRQASPDAPKRRYGAPMLVSSAEGQDYVIHTLGLGSNARLTSCDVFAINGHNQPLSLSPIGPSARVCHTLTDLGSYGVLLAGGRASPVNVLSDCWIFKKDSHIWQKSFDLPSPLFRHSTVRLPGSSLALTLGGRSGSSKTSTECFVFHPTNGWLKCAVSGAPLDPVFGAVVVNSLEAGSEYGVFRGLFAGGITSDGKISNRSYRWVLDINGEVCY